MFFILIGLVAVLPSLGLAQQQSDLFQKAPPAVEEALRQRVSIFYQAHVDAKFRQADKVVAEESKDEFFGMAKPVYQRFEILKFTFKDDFTKANVVTVVKREMIVRGNKMLIEAPVTSTWKVIGGEWFWYVDEMAGKEVATPMGTMHPGPDSGRPPGMSADFYAVVTDPKRRAELAEALLKKVSVNKTEVIFAPNKPGSDTVEISNALEGPIKVEMDVVGSVKGLTAKLDSADVPAGGKAIIRLNYVPDDLPPGAAPALTVRVSPTTQSFSIAIRFGAAK